MQIGFRTDIGQRRKNNEDAVGVFYNQENIPLAIVADGMGGHQAGDVASQMLVQNLGQAWELEQVSEEDLVFQWLLKKIQLENEEIFEHGEQDMALSGMGTTIVAVVPIGNKLLLAHVGDSRAYLFSEDHLKQVTEDHSLVNELVKSGEITKEQALVHPRRNVLIRSIGMPGVVEIDVVDIDWHVNDVLLLCSDGLTNMLSDEEIREILQSEGSLDQKLETMIRQANEAGGRDNITALMMVNREDGGEQCV